MTCHPRIWSATLLAVALLLSYGASHEGRAEPPAQKPSGSTCNRAEFRLIIDVGHTAKVPGAKSARGRDEYDFNLRLARRIDHKLIEAGFEKTVLLITDGAAHRSLGQRVARANKSSADLFLSIHHDSVPDSFLEKWQFEGREHGFSDRFRGHSIFVSHFNGDFAGSLAFARLLGIQLKARGLKYTPHYTEKFMGRRQRQLVDPEAGVYRYDQLIVLKDTRMPAVLLEAGSIINRDEELALDSPERQSLITAAVSDAVERFCSARKARSPDHIAHQPGHAAPSRPLIAPAALAR